MCLLSDIYAYFYPSRLLYLPPGHAAAAATSAHAERSLRGAGRQLLLRCLCLL